MNISPFVRTCKLGARADATTKSAASGYWVSMAKAKAKQPAKQASAAGGVPKKSHKKKPSSELIAPKPKPKRSEGNSAAAHVESTLAQILDSQPSEHALGHPRRRPAWPNRPFEAFWVWFHGHVFRNQAATATTSATSCDRSCSGRRGSSTEARRKRERYSAAVRRRPCVRARGGAPSARPVPPQGPGRAAVAPPPCNPHPNPDPNPKPNPNTQFRLRTNPGCKSGYRGVEPRGT